ncbi:MAG: molybdopterin biosynthesis protein [Methanotrichaceae archaeon]|nr:molybdopterin biosynthesis protein [Methanotrichaceae archaeon]
MRKEFRSLISLDEARSIVLSHAPRTEARSVPLQHALGRVLAEKVVSTINVPGFNRASMDGYAVIAQDTLGSREDRPVSLRLVGRVPMGKRPEVRLENDQAAEVSTGSMMPEGSDAVVMVEYCEEQDGWLRVNRPVHSGENVQGAGSDISFGEAVLFPGTVLTSRDVGVLAALGRDQVSVRRLKVGIASTGNELVSPGRDLYPGQIYDINSYSIAAAVEECGGEPVAFGILPDRKEAMFEVLSAMAAQCGLLLVSGSTSAGAGDMIYQVLDEIAETKFHGVNLKPGKPTIFAMLNETPCLGLPGYPTSALTVFRLLAAPAIARALGKRYEGRTLSGTLARPVRSESRRQMMAVGLAGGSVYPLDRGSGSITTLAQSDGVIEIPADVEYLKKGEPVTVQLFGDGIPDITIAGESCPLLEKVVEAMPYQVRYLVLGSMRSLIAVADGAADLGAISLPEGQRLEPPEGCVSIPGYIRELGLMARSPEQLAIEDRDGASVLGWSRESAMDAALKTALSGLNPTAEVSRMPGRAMSHSAVASSVASGRAQVGFCTRAAAEEAGLFFRPLVCDRMEFVCRSAGRTDAVDWFWSYLSSDELRKRLPAGITII